MVESRSPRYRLDTPKETRRSLVRRPSYDADAFGSFAEQFARFMGTARFLIYMTLFVMFWVIWNFTVPVDLRFDNYPFIFLTLMLSLQASYAAPLILLALAGQEDRDRVIGEQDRQANSRAHADMEFLAREMASLRMALGEVATRDYVRRLNWPTLNSLVDFMDDFGCTPMCPGVYEGGDLRALYFFKFADPSEVGPCSQPEHRQI